MRAIWSGAISFGLLNIPVRLFSAIQESKLDLDMLDKRDNANIRYARINESTGKEVPWADIVKGYKRDDDYVVLEDEDFEKVAPEKNKTIAIDEFAKEEMIDMMLFDTPYYLEPTKGGEKAYALLREAFVHTGKVAIGSFVLRTREILCMLKPHDDIILAVKLRYPEEIRKTDDLSIPTKTQVKAAELKMAVTLINQLTPKKFSIAKYKDTYDAELLKIIEMKAKGKKIARPKFKIVRNKSKDLMSQLKASLEENKKKAS